MPKPKIRKKRHNGMKRAQRFFNRTRIWTWEADRDPRDDTQRAIAEARTIRGWERLDGDVANAIVRHRHNWIICVRALCQNIHGVEWVEEEVRIARNVPLNDFQDLYLELRAEVLKAQRLDQVIDVGWICGTFGDSRTPDDEALSLHGIGKPSKERQATWRQVHEEKVGQREAA